METFEANKGALMETASPALPLSGLLTSTQAAISCGADKSAHTTIETSEGAPDFPENSSNPCIHTASPTSMTFVKKTTPSVCRNECRPEKSSRRLQKFCKRRNGLFKKAHELSNLYNAEVAVIVASPFGKVSEFASSSMSHILKRYQSFQPQMLSNNVLLHGVKTWKREAILPNSRLKALQELERVSKNMPSSINVAQSFESMLAQTLDEIHKRKMELLEVEIAKIIQEGEILFKENTMVKEKLMQLMLIKECISSAISGSEEFCYQPGLDMFLHCIEEESSTSSNS